jgi:hypothetical protein
MDNREHLMSSDRVDGSDPVPVRPVLVGPVSVRAPAREGRRVGRLLVTFAVYFGLLWLLAFSVWNSFPFIRPGAEIINESKIAAIGQGELFPPQAALRLAVFGNSRILSGFIPERFDRGVGGGIASFNLALAGNSYFLDELDRLVHSGNPPTHVLLQSVWDSADAESLWGAIKQDRAIIKWAFPFRTMPRDAVLFAVLSRSRNGLAAYYRKSAEIVQTMALDRGYFFIESQSHFAGHRLPDEYLLPTDTPNVVYPRPVTTSGPAFDRLLRLARTYDFEVILIPDNFRRRAFAPPPPRNDKVDLALAPFEGFHRIGPDYFLFDNSHYSDPVHLNPEGAGIYTDALARVFREFLDGRASSGAVRRAGAVPALAGNDRS